MIVLLQVIVALLFSMVPFVGLKSLGLSNDAATMLGAVIMTPAFGLLDVINERRGLYATQATIGYSLAVRVFVFIAGMYIGIVDANIASRFIAGMMAFGISQMLIDAPVYALLKRILGRLGFASRNIGSNLVGIAIFVLMSGGSKTALVVGFIIRILYSLLLLPMMLWLLRLIPIITLILALPVHADTKLAWSFRLTDPHHYETFVTVRVGRSWAQNLSLFDPGTTLPWNTKTTVGFDVWQAPWFTISAIGQHQTWEVWRPRVNWERPEAWRYGMEIRSK